jgi:hypothetical protein
MTGERKDEHWEQCVALIPINADVTAWGRLILMDGEKNDDEKKTFYKALLKISWLAPKIRRVVMNELGLSLRAQKNAFNQGWLMMTRHLITVEKERLKNAGERPRGGIHDAAIQKVAADQGKKVETLKKRLQNRKKQASRRSQKK